MIVRIPLIAAVSTLALAACGQPKTEADAPAEQQSVTRVDPAPIAEPAPAPAMPALQTQPGSDGLQVALTRASVVGDVLTVQLSYTKPGEGSASQRFPVEEVAVIDDTTAQRYGVLRDSTGRWQASPLQAAGHDQMFFSVNQDGPEIVWFKFPAPPATSPTVSINVPNVGPFDGVTVTR